MFPKFWMNLWWFFSDSDSWKCHWYVLSCLMKHCNFQMDTVCMLQPTLRYSRKGTGQPGTMMQSTWNRQRPLWVRIISCHWSAYLVTVLYSPDYIWKRNKPFQHIRIECTSTNTTSPHDILMLQAIFKWSKHPKQPKRHKQTKDFNKHVCIYWKVAEHYILHLCQSLWLPYTIGIKKKKGSFDCFWKLS